MGVKKVLGSKRFLGQKNFRLKIFLGQTKFSMKKFLGQKNFRLKKFLGQKDFGSKKNFFRKIFGQKNLDPKILCLKKNLGRVNPRGRMHTPPPENSRVKIVLGSCKFC